VIAFDAHVLQWSLDDAPPPEHTRHYIKEASFHGKDVWSVDLVLKLPADPQPIPVNFVGALERGIWPAKARLPDVQRAHAMRLFETADAWINAHTGGTVDTLMMGCVGGIVSV
jgi:hypothetical protein